MSIYSYHFICADLKHYATDSKGISQGLVIKLISSRCPIKSQGTAILSDYYLCSYESKGFLRFGRYDMVIILLSATVPFSKHSIRITD